MKLKSIYGYVLLALLFVGCNKEQGENDVKELRFNTYLKENDLVKPFSKALRADLASGFNLYGVVTKKVVTEDATPKLIFSNTPVSKEGVYGGGSRHWEMGGTMFHSFYAYSANPAGTAPGVGVTAARGPVGTKAPSITFTQDADPAKQIDLLIAEPVLNISPTYNTSNVNLYFGHRLARVVLRLIGTGAVTVPKCKITLAYRKPLPKTVDFQMNGDSPVLSPTAYHATDLTFLLKEQIALPSSAVNLEKSVYIADMFLMTHAYEEGAMELTLDYYLKEGDEGTHSVLKASLPALVTVRERQYTVLFNLLAETQDLTVADVLLEPWSNSSHTIDELN